jgi:hypothetical protein
MDQLFIPQLLTSNMQRGRAAFLLAHMVIEVARLSCGEYAHFDSPGFHFSPYVPRYAHAAEYPRSDHQQFKPICQRLLQILETE